jgi:hypothetical protein
MYMALYGGIFVDEKLLTFSSEALRLNSSYPSLNPFRTNTNKRGIKVVPQLVVDNFELH